MAEVIGGVLAIIAVFAFLACMVTLILALIRKVRYLYPATLFGVTVVSFVMAGVLLPPSEEDAPIEMAASLTPLPTPTAAPTPGPSPTPSPTPAPTVTPVPTQTPTLNELGNSMGAVQLQYDAILRDPEQHENTVVMLFGEVFQVVYAPDEPNVYGEWGQTALIDVGSSGRITRLVWLNFTGPRVLEGDRIGAVAEVRGIENYETQLGGKNSVPQLYAPEVRVTVPR